MSITAVWRSACAENRLPAAAALSFVSSTSLVALLDSQQALPRHPGRRCTTMGKNTERITGKSPRLDAPRPSTPSLGSSLAPAESEIEWGVGGLIAYCPPRRVSTRWRTAPPSTLSSSAVFSSGLCGRGVGPRVDWWEIE